jgi:hypothetical protein
LKQKPEEQLLADINKELPSLSKPTYPENGDKIRAFQVELKVYEGQLRKLTAER